MEFQGKVVLITGAGQNIGEGLVRRFAKEGARVAAVDLNGSLVSALETGSNGAILGIQGDMSKLADIEKAFDLAVEKFGGVDILVNCAMVRASVGLDQLDERMIDLATGVGIKGLIFCSRRAAREMRKRGGGVILNFSTFYTRTPHKERVLYTGIKGAVEALTRALAVELGDSKVRVNAVAPGPVLTANRAAQGHADPDKMEPRYRVGPMARFGTVDEVVESVLFLCSSRSSYCTGALLRVDGGLTLA